MLSIRPATVDDLPAVTGIYAHHVRTGTGTFETEPPSLAEMSRRYDEVIQRGLPWLVATASTTVIGFAYCNWFKPRPAYRFSAEDSIYVAPDHLGRGLGRALLAELTAQAERAGVRQMIAVVGDSNNLGSIGLHQALGFQVVGTLAACGWKFERWLDVVLMQKPLGNGAATRPETQMVE